MVNRTRIVSTLALALLPATALAVQPVQPSGGPASAIASTGERQLTDGTILRSASPRHFRANALPEPALARAWGSLHDHMGSAWATWSDGHPRQIIGAGIPAPGTVASAAEAERVAWEVLTQHIDVLAPGLSVSDFVLISNHESAGIRSVGFSQRSAGREVVGGQIGLSFKYDRLVLITDLVKPHASIPTATSVIAESDARDTARAMLLHDPALALAPAGLRTTGPVDGPLVLPVGDDATGPRYREVVRVEVESEAPLDRYWVYLDSQTGEPVARESRMHRAAGLVLYNVSDRSPIFPRVDRETPFTLHIVDGVEQVSDGGSTVTFAGATSNVQPGLFGPYVEIIDEAGPLASDVLVLADGGFVTWSRPSEEFFDAQISTYAHTTAVKNYVRTLAPDLGWLDGTITATVNIDDQCNAMSDGDSIYFFRSSDVCENTARMSDVVFHEFGHSVHHQSIIPGVGAFDGALSEGIADYLAATLVNDSGMGRGFFYTSDPLRELDPPDYEWKYPDDDGEIHAAGRIIGGTLWDLRKELIQKYGPALGIYRTDIIWYEATRRAVDMPSMYGAALLANDDDGNLANGTPDGCEINQVFGEHGLFAGTGETAERVTAAPDAGGGLHVHLDLALPSFEACPVSASARVEWRERDGDTTIQSIDMVGGGGGYDVVVPALPDGSVLNYRVVVSYSVGAERTVPANEAYPWFEHYFGPVEPIYCTSFESGIADGWSISPRWEVAPPAGLGGDPGEPDGADPYVLGLDISNDGFYQPFSTEGAFSPVIPVPSGYDAVRLQYKRWLTVEDGFYDQAFIFADEGLVWSNYSSPTDDASTHHRDAQWMFHDVDIGAFTVDGEVQVGFELSSDAGLEFGGWTVDEFCVVGVRGQAPPPGCGNGIVEDGEQCDDGNLAPGDGCSELCQVEGDDGGDPSGGDPSGGDDGDSDGDSDGDEPGLTDDGRLLDRGCACTAGDSGPTPGPLGMLVLLALAGWRRRSA